MSKIVLQGFLYDDRSSFMKGPAMAPPRIRKAYHSPSANYYAENGLEILPNRMEDMGDFAIKEYFEIESITGKNLEKGLPVLTLGGDHSITYPILKSFRQKHGPISILHIDAHSDLYSDFEGDPYSHACPFFNIMKDTISNDLTQVGVRTLNQEQRTNAAKYGVNICEMKDFENFLMPRYNDPIYLSLDIDALDPAFAPGVSHHEPGGLSIRQVIKMIQDIPVPILGADIVEYNPLRDRDGITAMVCAKLLKEIVAKMV
ncbi:MAG: agmatinase family protein [Bacteroidota bacterium]